MLLSTDITEMAIQRFVVLFLMLVSTSCAQYQRKFSRLRRFSCSREAREQPLNLAAMAGYWYEAARVPNMDIMKCLNVSVPPTADRKLKLKLEYISTIHGNIHAVKETVAFPWDNFTKNSVFQLIYKTEKANVTVTYKVLYSDPQLMTILCGYSTISPLPMFKLLTRQQRLDPNIVHIIEENADRMGIGSQIIWTEQSPDRCSAAKCLTNRSFNNISINIPIESIQMELAYIVKGITIVNTFNYTLLVADSSSTEIKHNSIGSGRHLLLTEL